MIVWTVRVRCFVPVLLRKLCSEGRGEWRLGSSIADVLPRTVRDILGEAWSRQAGGESWVMRAGGDAAESLRLELRGSVILLRWSLGARLIARPVPVILLCAG